MPALSTASEPQSHMEEAMSDTGKILLADDEINFQQATAELLREQGYSCDVVSDAHAAAERLQHQTYDVLIADIKMPGNTELEFIRDLAAQAQKLSIILVTGYPSTQTAIETVQLPVLAYLVKPFRFGELLNHVRFGVERSQANQAIDRLRHTVQVWNQELEGATRSIATATPHAFADPLGVFLQASFRRVIMTLEELEAVTGVLARHEQSARHGVFTDPRVNLLKEALTDTIGVLEKTKHAFKSKDLGRLRKRLEELVAQVERAPA